MTIKGHHVLIARNGKVLIGVMETKTPLAPDGGLAAHEGIDKGHLLREHVGKTDKELIQRLKNDPKLKSASTFKNRATAEKIVSKILENKRNKDIIKKWSKDSSIEEDLVLKYLGNTIIGRRVKRGSSVAENVKNVRIILRKKGHGYYIHSGYPVK